jgi:protein-L-isoaspartate(D-aspartate) O-methyltransferase
VARAAHEDYVSAVQVFALRSVRNPAPGENFGVRGQAERDPALPSGAVDCLQRDADRCAVSQSAVAGDALSAHSKTFRAQRWCVLILSGFTFAAVELTPAQTNNAGGSEEARFKAAREWMVRNQLAGPWRDITNARVLAVMGKVPRHEFVPESFRSQAYSDGPLPIGYGQTISQPYIVAFMTEKLEPKSTDRVLEIGTGSGYQAAVLAELVKEVYTIEIVEPLAKRAEADLKRLSYTNVHVRAGDGYKGWPEASPFDAIIVTCAPEKVPQPLVEQLKDGGRMIIPVGAAGDQELVMLRKKGERLEKRAVLPVRFVPMTGEAQRAPQKPKMERPSPSP